MVHGLARAATQPNKIFDSHLQGFSGEAAPLFMNTGIAEVSLPVEFRLRNIEETDKVGGSGGMCGSDPGIVMAVPPALASGTCRPEPRQGSRPGSRL